MYQPSDFAWLAEKRYNKYSQFGEDGILEAVFERIGMANKWCCECGAADGIFFSNTKALIEEGWSALLIEADQRQAKKCAEVHKENEKVHVYCERIEPGGLHGFDFALKAFDAPLDLDLLVIDVDGQDYWLFNSLVRYYPRVVMVEYDPTSDKEYIPPMGEPGQAGLHAIINLGIGKYYWPVAITSTNVIFVQQELCPMLLLTADVRPCEECGKWIADSIRGFCAECWGKQNTRPQHESRDGAAEKPPPGPPRTKARLECRLHESESGSPRCVHCGLPGVWPLVGKSVASKSKPDDAPRSPKLAAVMSTPRLGFLATMDCIYKGLMPLNVPLLRGEGAFWHQTLERAIEKAIAEGAEYILTFDYDVVFASDHGNNDIAKLVCLMEDHPAVDIIISAQMKREKGALLASSDKEVALLEPLVPVTCGHFGLTIFRASSFARIPKPWLRDWPNEENNWNENRIDADIFFWKQAVAAGLDIRLSLDVLVGHLEQVVTWPGQNLQTVYQSISEWREHGRPAEAFDRQRVIAAVKANPALLYGPKLEMGG